MPTAYRPSSAVPLRAMLDSFLGPSEPTPAEPTMRAPTPYERYIQPVANQVSKIGTFLAGDTPEQQAMAMAPAAFGVGLAARKPAEALSKLVRVAEGANPNPKALQYLQEAVEYYAQKHPRLLSHLDEIVVNPRLESGNAKVGSIANMDMGQSHVLAMKPGGVKYLSQQKRPIGTMNVSAEAMENWALPEQAREVVGHELGHTAQFLGDPSRMGRAYTLANQTFGYAGNPAEDLANIIGKKHRQGVSWKPVKPEPTPGVLWKDVKRVTPGAIEDHQQALRNWEFFREQFPRETIKGPSARAGWLQEGGAEVYRPGR